MTKIWCCDNQFAAFIYYNMIDAAIIKFVCVEKKKFYSSVTDAECLWFYCVMKALQTVNCESITGSTYKRWFIHCDTFSSFHVVRLRSTKGQSNRFQICEVNTNFLIHYYSLHILGFKFSHRQCKCISDICCCSNPFISIHLPFELLKSKMLRH